MNQPDCDLMNKVIRDLKAENAKLKKEIARINGPFTCKHDPSYVGGACAACHAEALEKVSVLDLQVDGLRKAVEYMANPDGSMHDVGAYKRYARGVLERFIEKRMEGP